MAQTLIRPPAPTIERAYVQAPAMPVAQTLPGRDAADAADDFLLRLGRYAPKTRLGTLVKSACINPALMQDESFCSDLLETLKFTWVPTSQLSVRVFRGLDGTPWVHPMDEAYDLGYVRALSHRVGKNMVGLPYHPLLDPRDPKWRELIEDYGIVCRKMITNGGIDYMVSDFAGGAGDISNFHFHGIGTGTGAEAATDTALGTELTTEYNPNSTRATGSQVANTAPTPDTFSTVGTNTLDSGTPAVTEHGIFSATSSGTLWDRSVFSAINLVGANGDGLQSTYTLTLNAGG